MFTVLENENVFGMLNVADFNYYEQTTKDEREYFFEWKIIAYCICHRPIQINFSRIPKSDKCLFDRKTICKERKTTKIINLPKKSDID